MKDFILSLVVTLLSVACHGQVTTTYTEDELALHSEFIDAAAQKYKGELSKAALLFEEILKKDNSHHAAAFEVAKIKFEQKKYEESIRFGNKALDKNPNDLSYLSFLSDACLEIKDYKNAIVFLDQRMNLNASNRAIYSDLAFAYFENNNPKKALEVLNSLEKLDGISEYTSKRKYKIHQYNGDVELAEKELLALVASQPKSVRYLTNLAKFYDQTKQKDKAHNIYKEILSIDPDNAKANMVMAAKLNGKNNASSYLLSLEPIVNNPEVPLDAKIKELIPFIEKATPKSDSTFTKALKNTLESVRNTHPKDPKGFALTADFFSRTAQNEKAIEYYLKTLKLNDNVFSVWEQLLFVLDEENKYALLKDKSYEAMDLFPNQAISYVMHAKALINLNEPAEAKEYLDEARLIAGKNKEILQLIDQLSKTIN